MQPHLQRETPQPSPHLPRPWHHLLDRRNGFTIGTPPGWRVAHRHGTLLVRSADRLVAVSVGADRRPRALAIPPDRFAKVALDAVSGYRHSLRPSPPKRFARTPFDGVRVHATGVSADGVTQHVKLIVLRRDHLANLTLVIAANHITPGREVTRALRMARTLRDHPTAPRSRRGGGQPGGGRSGRSG